MKHSKLFRKLVLWVVLGVVISAFSGLVYITMQQDLRLSANDPQIQMAEDTAANLDSGQQVQIAIPSQKIDVAKSLAPFLIVYDTSGNITSSSGLLDGKVPMLPSGIFNNVRPGEKRFTWQPRDSVRIAAVVVPYKNGYVLAGRSLREVEKREDHLMQEVVVGWVGTIGLVTVLLFLL